MRWLLLGVLLAGCGSSVGTWYPRIQREECAPTGEDDAGNRLYLCVEPGGRVCVESDLGARCF